MAEAQHQLTTDDRLRNRNIPVLTVLKNNAILKNIFLIPLRAPPPDMRNPQDGDGAVLVQENETEQILTVGRHPNCSIVLSHPSISRFHLQIRSKPNSGKLSVTDLSSVHGTCVSGKRIRPRDCVELNEGDELRLGGSSRVYKLHWVSACQVYDLDNPFCQSSDVVMRDHIQKHEEESLFLDEDGVLSSGRGYVSLNSEAKTSFVTCQEVPPVGNETVLRGILKHKKESSPCMVMPLSFPLLDGETMKVAEIEGNDVEKQLKNAPLIQLAEDEATAKVLNSEATASLVSCQEVPLQRPVRNETVLRGILTHRKESSPCIVKPLSFPLLDEEPTKVAEVGETEYVSDLKSIHDESKLKPEALIQLAEVESQSLQLIVNSAMRLGPNEENVAIESGNGTLVSDSGIQILEPLLDSFLFTEKDSKESCGFMSMKSELESQSPKTPFVAKSILGNGYEKGSQTVSNGTSNMSNISSQRCQPLGPLKIMSCSSKVKRRGSAVNARSQLKISSADEKTLFKTQYDQGEDKNETCTPEKEKCRYNTQPLKCMKNMCTLDDIEFSCSKSYTSQSQNISSSRAQKASSKTLMTDLENVEYEVEMYTPDKENFTPNTRLLKSIKRMGLFNENTMKSSVSENRQSVKVSNSSYRAEQNYCSGSEKENDSVFFGQERAWPDARNQDGNKETSVYVQRKLVRVPLQSLSNISSCRSEHDSSSVNKAPTVSRGSVTRAQFQRKISPIKNKIELEAKAKWCMVVDAACLLDCESRKALTLLQGLRGTRLTVPGAVLRELDAMKHKASFFRQTTGVSAALKWLEDCLVNTKWWIHTPISFEEARHLLPTPPASPKLVDSTNQNGKKSWKTFSFFRNLLEISSPKAEDHILEYALQQMRSINDNQRVVVLSKDTSLRIKATAQGLICETAKEFRDSLVNPFSERFLWTGSSPRGRTWSCHDDIVLREQFYSNHSTNPSKRHDSVKGLKLILAYDSRDK